MLRHCVKMSSEGLIVLPEEVMKKSKLRKNGEVEFFVGEGRIEIQPVPSIRSCPVLAIPAKHLISQEEDHL